MNKHLKIWAAAGMMALFMGTAAAAPQAMFQKFSIVASAEESGDYTYRVESDGSVTITKYKGTTATVTVPKTIAGKTVKKITGAFQNNNTLTKVVLQSGITTLDNYAFAKCPKLATVTLPNTLTTINWNVFESDTSLKTISLPSSLKTVGSNAFKGSGLTKIAFGANVTLGGGALSDCKSLTSVTLPSNLTEISAGLFSGSAIASVSIPSGVTKIGQGAFSYTNISKITLPSKLTEIGGSAFINTKLTAVTLPGSLVTIGKSAFKELSITKVTIPNKVTSIGDYAFSGTPLSNVVFASSSSLKTIGSYAFSKTSLTTIALPGSLTTIGGGAFSESKLTSITIPKSVTNIVGYAFSKCQNLSAVKINGTATIGVKAFADCDKLTNIDMNIATWEKSLSQNALSGCKNLMRISGTNLVQYLSNGEPYIPADYWNGVRKSFTTLDADRTPFFEKYLTETIAYVVRTQTAGCKTDAQKIKKLHDWLCNKVAYAKVNGKPDPSTECHVDSSAFIRDTTVCDGYARALTLLLRKAGFETNYVVGDVDFDDDLHAWVIVKLGGRYFNIDPTWDDGSTITYTNFLKSDAEFVARNHVSWKVRMTGSIYDRESSRITANQSASTPKCPYSIGDVNKDGLVNGADKSLILKHIAKIQTISSANFMFADINCDGTIDISDAVKLNVMYGDMGDANRDGKVDNNDVTRITHAASGKVTLNVLEKALADVNYDGKITMEDATILNQAIHDDEVYLL